EPYQRLGPVVTVHTCASRTFPTCLAAHKVRSVPKNRPRYEGLLGKARVLTEVKFWFIGSSVHFMQSPAEASDSPTRARILAAAGERFAAFGYRRTGIPETARDAGVAPGTLYRYFENKEEIFRAVMREGLARWLETARRVLAQPGTALDRLARLGQASVDYNRENAL